MKRTLFTFALLVALAALAPLLARSDPMLTSEFTLAPPSLAHPLGTDQLGRDVLSRLLVGGQRSLLIAALAAGIATAGGLLLGLLAVSGSLWLDHATVVLIDAALAFPALLLALVLLTLLGAGQMQIALAAGAALMPQYARLSRAALISARASGYVEAAVAVGANRAAILLRHILPNIAPALLTYAGVMFSYSLFNSAALSFLGLGGSLGVPDWGVMLLEGRQVLRVAPWVSIAPGTAISLVVFLVNRASDQLSR